MRHWIVASVIVTAFLGACAAPDATPGTAAGTGEVPVVRVVDGDTLWVLRAGREEKIRLIGIDAPEVDWYGGQAECHGAESGRFLRRLVLGERVRLEHDRERLDRYDRTLAYVYLGDEMVNERLVREGYTTVTIYSPNDRHEDVLRAAERVARNRGAGLWSACA